MLSLLLFAAGVLAAPLEKRQAPSGVPDFALTYAPVAYLYSKEAYYPADIGSQLVNTQPQANYTPISNLSSRPLSLDNLDQLNAYGRGGQDVYLTSKDNVEDIPAWLRGAKPDSNGLTNGAVSSTVIVNNHGSGMVDVFYFYFYAFNFGGKYISHVIGNHVGDWEHTMVRFKDGKPQAIWYSQHSNGEAFEYRVVKKYNNGARPVVYIGNGTHANYAIPGDHDHAIPNVNLPQGLVEDHTDQGAFWDPIQSAYWFSFNASSQIFTSYDGSTRTNWLYYVGHWGDKQYRDSDPRQKDILDIDGSHKYTNGPTGPINKQLNRTKVCPDNGNLCIVRAILGP
ncbi:uncharacterized protein LTR77_010076 [Saxophila tyrrhenica]|uniref:Vacuolar protein sorting-associated protein 62 n=1 Tax=Saxophila tyrrhenica TaxID=1690608 RepID=A0AAV9NXD1_9PEZI|nr:hypothetical protein LTR77_010076 [Saxophila tyrrhenica]